MNARSSAPQTFANHRAYPPWWYFFAGVVIALDILRRGWLAFSERSLGYEHWLVHLWYVLLLSAIFALWIHSRRSAQIVQDRVIRLEMRMRLERLLGPQRRTDIERLPLTHLIALRFASDAEMPALFEDALAGKFAKADDLKRSIQSWQADWLRV